MKTKRLDRMPKKFKPYIEKAFKILEELPDEIRKCKRGETTLHPIRELVLKHIGEHSGRKFGPLPSGERAITKEGVVIEVGSWVSAWDNKETVYLELYYKPRKHAYKVYLEVIDCRHIHIVVKKDRRILYEEDIMVE